MSKVRLDTDNLPYRRDDVSANILIVPPHGRPGCPVTQTRFEEAHAFVIKGIIPEPDFMIYPQGDGLGEEMARYARGFFPNAMCVHADVSWDMWSDMDCMLRITQEQISSIEKVNFYFVAERPRILQYRIVWWALRPAGGKAHFFEARNIRPPKECVTEIGNLFFNLLRAMWYLIKP